MMMRGRINSPSMMKTKYEEVKLNQELKYPLFFSTSVQTVLRL